MSDDAASAVSPDPELLRVDHALERGDHPLAARLARARQLLAETGLTISQIAETLGFRDVFFFSRQFTQRTGQTPSAYRAALSP